MNTQYSENGMFYWFRVGLIDEGVLQGGKLVFQLINLPLIPRVTRSNILEGDETR